MKEQTGHFIFPRTNRKIWLGITVLAILVLVALLLLVMASPLPAVHADPIPPPEGYPKLSLSTKMVTPTLIHTGGEVLYYAIEIRNTGAYTAELAALVDVIPEDTAYNNDGQSSVPPDPEFSNGTLTWQGDVGFDTTVVISFSVTVDPAFAGVVENVAVISHPLIAQPVTVTARTVVTDQSILTIAKSADPTKPGANKPISYTLVVTNEGQPAVALPLTVVDRVPENTTLDSVGPDCDGSAGDVVTCTRLVDMNLGETTLFTFSVDVNDVPSGTVIANDEYWVESSETGMSPGEPYTLTVVDPILLLFKEVWPDPPGANHEMTYTLTVLNVGSLATNLVITDRVPDDVVYVRGGSYSNGVVSWALPQLNTGKSAEFTFTVYVDDVMDVTVVNDEHGVCCGEGVCQAGDVLTSVVDGPNFEAFAYVDPIAHKPGGGTGTEVTPTLVVHNLGPGNALDAQANLYLRRLSVQLGDLVVIPPVGVLSDGPDCGDKCNAYVWVGDIGIGDTITFTTDEGQNTIGGEEGTHYTATVVITDALSNMTTEPVSDTAIGLITHFANIVPEKTAPPVIGRGELLTYTIEAFNRGMTTDEPPILTDVVPLSTTFVWASHDGVALAVGDMTIVSWTLPILSPGDGVVRRFSVLVDDDLVSGTLIVNEDYSVTGYGNVVTDAVTSGPPVTTTVKEVGLIDSYKEVTPALALPGPGIVLTYYLHIVNSGPVFLNGVTVYDLMPWQVSTYQQDAVASAGQLEDDIISFHWMGNVDAFSSEMVTFTVLVDPYYQGPVTNTATINHASLLGPIVVEAVAYITDLPVLRISKKAKPDPVVEGEELAYTIYVVNLGQQATDLLITDTIPLGTEYVPGSAASGELVNGQVQWQIPILEPGERRTFGFRVTVGDGEEVVNDSYVVTCAEGVMDRGSPVVTPIVKRGGKIYLPVILRNGG